MVTKSTNAHRCIELSYIINIVCILFVSATLVTIHREVHFKGWIYQVIMVYEPNYRCKMLSFKNVWFKIHIKI